MRGLCSKGMKRNKWGEWCLSFRFGNPEKSGIEGLGPKMKIFSLSSSLQWMRHETRPRSLSTNTNQLQLFFTSLIPTISL